MQWDGFVLRRKLRSFLLWCFGSSCSVVLLVMSGENVGGRAPCAGTGGVIPFGSVRQSASGADRRAKP